jgi:hypothetical protein
MCQDCAIRVDTLQSCLAGRVICNSSWIQFWSLSKHLELPCAGFACHDSSISQAAGCTGPGRYCIDCLTGAPTVPLPTFDEYIGQLAGGPATTLRQPTYTQSPGKECVGRAAGLQHCLLAAVQRRAFASRVLQRSGWPSNPAFRVCARLRKIKKSLLGYVCTAARGIDCPMWCASPARRPPSRHTCG